MKNPLMYLVALSLSLPLAACGGAETEGAAEPEPVAQVEQEAEPAPTIAESSPALPGVLLVSVEVECPELRVFFETDSSELTASAQAALDAYAECLQAEPGSEPVELTGMTDPRAPEPYNEELARQRAESVASYLRDQGIEAGFEIHPLGETGAVEGVPALWPLQRRVLIE